MARTYAQANTERLRLLALGRKLQVKFVKMPLLGSDGAVWPGGNAVNDWMLAIKDPRPTGTSIGLAAAQNQVGAYTPQAALAATRWHGGAAEHATRFHPGGLKGQSGIGLSTPHVGWKIFGAGETREGGEIQNSAAVFV